MAYKNTKHKVKQAYSDELEKNVTIDEDLLKIDDEADEEHTRGCGKCKKKKNKNGKNKKK